MSTEHASAADERLAEPAPTGDGRGLQLAYAYLNRRERTTAEVRARLARAEVPQDEIDAVLGELTEYGYLDDARYARLFVEDKRTLEQWGEQRIARGLRERGITADLIRAALSLKDAAAGEGGPGEGQAQSELDRAVSVLERRFPAGVQKPRDRERAFGVLMRKGYESEVASAAVRAWVTSTR